MSIQVTTPARGTHNPHRLRVRWQRRAFDPDVATATATFNEGIPGFNLTVQDLL